MTDKALNVIVFLIKSLIYTYKHSYQDKQFYCLLNLLYKFTVLANKLQLLFKLFYQIVTMIVREKWARMGQ